MIEQVVIPFISSFITGLATWVFARRKNNAEASLLELDVIDKVKSFYRDEIDYTQKIIEELRNENKELKLEVQQLREELKNVNNIIRSGGERNSKQKENRE